MYLKTTAKTYIVVLLKISERAKSYINTYFCIQFKMFEIKPLFFISYKNIIHYTLNRVYAHVYVFIVYV